MELFLIQIDPFQKNGCLREQLIALRFGLGLNMVQQWRIIKESQHPGFKCSGASKDTNPPCKFITLKLSHSVVLPGRLFHLVNLGELKFWNLRNKNTKKSPSQLSNTARISSPSGVFTAARPAATNWFTEENPVTSTGYDLCLLENKLKTYLTIYLSLFWVFPKHLGMLIHCRFSFCFWSSIYPKHATKASRAQLCSDNFCMHYVFCSPRSSLVTSQF